MTKDQGWRDEGGWAELRCHRKGHVARLTLDRPERRNALTWGLIGELTEALRTADADPEVRVIVLTGAGEQAFCAGADLGAMTGEDFAALHEARGSLARLVATFYELGTPTIARVRGWALAGGFGLALACDMVVAAEDARFATPEADLGLWAHVITVPLIRSMPPKVALDLMLTGRRVDAEEGRRLGFVTRVAPVGELDAAVDDLAATIAAKAPLAVSHGRRSFYSVLDQDVQTSLRILHPMLTVTAATQDAAEGLAAFRERRPPRWSGR